MQKEVSLNHDSNGPIFLPLGEEEEKTMVHYPWDDGGITVKEYPPSEESPATRFFKKVIWHLLQNLKS